VFDGFVLSNGSGAVVLEENSNQLLRKLRLVVPIPASDAMSAMMHCWLTSGNCCHGTGRDGSCGRAF